MCETYLNQQTLILNFLRRKQLMQNNHDQKTFIRNIVLLLSSKRRRQSNLCQITPHLKTWERPYFYLTIRLLT